MNPAPNRSPKRILALERLARKIYDESNAGPKPWLRLGWDVREAWLEKAEAILDTAGPSFDWLYFWRPARPFGDANRPVTLSNREHANRR